MRLLNSPLLTAASFAAFVLVSCVPPAATDEEKSEALGTVAFDPLVIKNLPRYAMLRDFLDPWIDTLISTRDAQHLVKFVNGSRDGRKDTTYAERSECYTFFEGNSQYDLTTSPPFLQERLDSLFHQFGAQEIRSFEVCVEGRVVIEIRSDTVTENLSVTHELIWDPLHKPDRVNTSTYILDKDTLLSSGCTYRLGLVEDRGW